MNSKPATRTTKPAWLRKRLPSGPAFGQVTSLLSEHSLHTVCQEAKCPNQWECFSRGTATFMIMGDKCTRDCRFCAVSQGPNTAPDAEEARRVARAAKALHLRYVVLTSVTRDDLQDGGASCFVETIQELKEQIPAVRIEVLIPDFQGDHTALARVTQAGPHVLNHNIETVPRLYPVARPQADYQQSLQLLSRAHALNGRMPIKSGLMLGLGERREEILQVMDNLLQTGCSILTLGQYLQPTARHLPVERYLPPEEFLEFETKAYALGFQGVASGPFVRSSYKAASLFEQSKVYG